MDNNKKIIGCRKIGHEPERYEDRHYNRCRFCAYDGLPEICDKQRKRYGLEYVYDV